MQTHDIDGDIEEGDRTLPAIWLRRLSAPADAAFLWFEGKPARTLREFEGERQAAMRFFLARKIVKGDRVCILMQNSPQMLAAMLAAWSVGAVVVPLSAQLIGAILTDQVKRAKASVIVCDGALADRLQFASAMVATRESVFAHCGQSADDISGGETPAFSDPAMILYTSGSTGPSKGCILSHHFCVYYAWVFWRYMGYRQDDVIYSCLPLNHVHALFASFLPAILSGGRFSFAERFSASRYWSDIADSGATTCSAIGPMATILLGQPVAPVEQRLKVRLAHIAPAPARAREFERRFRLKIASALYGMSEAMIFPPDLAQPPIAGVLGSHAPDWDLSIVDDLDRPVKAGEPGELVARPRRAHILFSGYLDMPEQTVNAWRGLWYRTGDVCRRDADGRVWFMGRSRDLIRRRGENISAWELESIFGGHAEIAEAAAIRIPAYAGEDDVAVIVRCAPEARVTQHDLQLFSEQALPRFMRPDHIVILTEEFPKTPSGKIDKIKLSDVCGDRLKFARRDDGMRS